MKLISINRTINVYDKKDNLIDEIDILISDENLKQIVQSEDDDPELYDGYELSFDQLNNLTQYMSRIPNIDTNNYNFYLVTTGIYE